MSHPNADSVTDYAAESKKRGLTGRCGAASSAQTYMKIISIMGAGEKRGATQKRILPE
jgi:hypothetical protein